MTNPGGHSFRSRAWLESGDLYGWTRKAALLGMGFDWAAVHDGPIIGIGNTYSELVHCNSHLRTLAEAVKRGVHSAGGLPLEFPVMSLGEFNMLPTTMLYRNLASMDVEESIRANPLDGVVLLSGCDKTTPALLMGAASADVPALLLTGGPQLSVHWRGEVLGSCTDCRRYQTELRAGNISPDDWHDLQTHMVRGPGHCMTMGTASTMAVLSEAMGMSPPGSATVPAVDARRLRLAEAAGRQIVALARNDVRPSHILTRAAFTNAIRTLHAIGGSTNAVIHLIAIAGRLGIDLPLPVFDELSDSTPLLLNLKPSGAYLMEDFEYAGGAPALLAELAPLLDTSCTTVSGKSLGENLAGARTHNREVIRSLNAPLRPDGGLCVLYGSLAPRGAIIKRSAASSNLLRHRGRAIVFDGHDDLETRIDDPALDVRPDDVLVLRGAGPLGAPGMPEWGVLPIPQKLLKQGVRDMVRISDARISGTAAGTVVVHVSPESAAGGPLAAVQTGDTIALDVPARKLELLVPPEEIERRLSARSPDQRRAGDRQRTANPPEATAPSDPRQQNAHRGYRWLVTNHILQADQGCDFDFLRADFEG